MTFAKHSLFATFPNIGKKKFDYRWHLHSKLHIHGTHLSKIENGHLLPSIDIVQRLMKVFAVSADNLLNDEENSVVELENHELNEQLMLINQLDEEEKNALIKIINSMLTKKRMKDLLDGKAKF